MRESISFRRQTAEDIPFLLELYASTRVEELKIVPWDDEQKTAFVNMQFNAQKSHYEQHYPDCAFLIVERDGNGIGRLYVDRTPEDICVIDITLQPACRSSGLGTMLIREILGEAAETNRSVTLHVEFFNPALRLYERLGFKIGATHGVYYELQWRAAEVAGAAV